MQFPCRDLGAGDDGIHPLARSSENRNVLTRFGQCKNKAQQSVAFSFAGGSGP